MKRKPSLLHILALVSLAAATHAAVAGDLDGVDSRFRAKIVKEKARQAGQQYEQDKKNQNGANDSNAECGSQNIGNVDTNGRPGTAPREIFVFAPNAINIVSGRGCGN